MYNRSDFPAITWIKSGKFNPDAANDNAENNLNVYLNYANKYIENPESHLGKLGWITSIINLYCGIKRIDVANSFFQQIDLKSLAKLYQKETPSFLCNFLRHLSSYLQKVDILFQRTVAVKSVFEELDLEQYASYVNNEIQKRWEILSNKPDLQSDKIACFTKQEYANFLERFPIAEEIIGPLEKYDNNKLYIYIDTSDISDRQKKYIGSIYDSLIKEYVDKTMGSIVQDIDKFSNRMCKLVEEKSIQNIIKLKVSSFCSKIDFSLLGKLTEAQKKGISPISQQLGKLKNKQSSIQFLSEINFNRLAISYNKNPVGSTRLATFCGKGSSLEPLLPQWKVFFQTLNFNIPFKLAHIKKQEYRKIIEKFSFADEILNRYLVIKDDDICISVSEIPHDILGKEVIDELLKYCGFNPTAITLLFRTLQKVFERDTHKLRDIFEQFDFRQIGIRIQGKQLESIYQLLKRLKHLDLSKDQYRDFIDGVGVNGCRRLLNEGSKNLEIILRYKCRYSEKELDRFIL